VKQPETVLGLFQPHQHIYSLVEKYADEAETSLNCFSCFSNLFRF